MLNKFPGQRHKIERTLPSRTFFVKNKMSDEKANLEKVDIEPIPVATVVTQPSNVVVVQPTRALPGHWSVGELNGACLCAMLVPCLSCAWAVSNGRKEALRI